jgi:hypothetical protein
MNIKIHNPTQHDENKEGETPCSSKTEVICANGIHFSFCWVWSQGALELCQKRTFFKIHLHGPVVQDPVAHAPPFVPHKMLFFEYNWWYIERSRECRTVEVAAVGKNRRLPPTDHAFGKNRRPPSNRTTTGLNGRGGFPESPGAASRFASTTVLSSPLILETKPRSPNAPPFVRYIVVLFYFFYFVLSAPRTSLLGALCPAANYLPDQIGARLLRQLIICPLDHRSQLAANYLPRPTANYQSGSSRLVRLRMLITSPFACPLRLDLHLLITRSVPPATPAS